MKSLPRAITILLVLFLCDTVLSAQTWTSRAPVPGGPRQSAISFTIGAYVYVGGGWGRKDMYRYDTRTDQWTRIDDIPGAGVERAAAVAFSIGSKGYVCGGTNLSGPLRDLWAIDSSDNIWKSLPDYPGSGCWGMIASVINARAYVGGGTDIHTVVGDFYEFDPAAGIWTQKKELPVPVLMASAFRLDSSLYIVAGSSGSAQVNNLYRYDPAGDVWTRRADIPGRGRSGVVAFAANGHGYVGAGLTWEVGLHGDFYRYDPAGDAWAPVGEYLSDSPRMETIAASVGGRIFLGTGGDANATHRYDDWRELNAASLGVDRDAAPAARALIVPNPAHDVVMVHHDCRHDSGTMVVFDVTGAEVLRQDLAPEQDRDVLDISALHAGVYVLRISGSAPASAVLLIKQ